MNGNNPPDHHFPVTGHRMPVLFIGHGSPENALGLNKYNSNWKRLGELIPKPALILCISAHWVIGRGTAVTAMEKPRTIHDFYGFPQELYRIQYPAPGSPDGAAMVQSVIGSESVYTHNEWGLDHGTWSVLCHMYPKADIPVIQLSLNYGHPATLHYQRGKELAQLRDRGVLIIGSGNCVHNLMMLRSDGKTWPWATQFEEFVRYRILAGDHESLVRYESYANARSAHPSSEHYLPLLYALGASAGDSLQFFNEGMFAGSVSMRSVIFGNDVNLQ
jgi:4,5-DOPA dioxygenase extradiol